MESSAVEATFLPTLAAVAADLGLSRCYVSILRTRLWFPAKRADGWPIEAIREAYQSNVQRKPDDVKKRGPRKLPKRKKKRRRSTAGAKKITAKPLERRSRSAGLRSDDPLEVAKAAVGVAGERLSDAADDLRRPIDREVRALTAALQELRRSTGDQLKIEVARGHLIERSEAELMAGALARTMVRALERVEDQLVDRVESWIADEAFLAATESARRSRVNAWSRKLVRDARAAAAKAIPGE